MTDRLPLLTTCYLVFPHPLIFKEDDRMLVLTRRQDERINIGRNIQVVVLGIQGNRVRLGVAAPSEVPILREEVLARTEWTMAAEPCDATVCTVDNAGVLQ
jgi:carbon storage regulator